MRKIFIITVLGLMCLNCWDVSEEKKITKGKCRDVDKNIFKEIKNTVALGVICDIPAQFGLTKICEIKKRPNNFVNGYQVKSRTTDCGTTRMSLSYGPPFEDTIPIMWLNDDNIDYVGKKDKIIKFWGLKKSKDTLFEGLLCMTADKLIYFFYTANNTYCVTSFGYALSEKPGLCLLIYNVEPFVKVK